MTLNFFESAQKTCTIFKNEHLLKILKAIEVSTLRRSICNISTRDIDRIHNHLALEAFDKEDPINYKMKQITEAERVRMEVLQKRTPKGHMVRQKRKSSG